MLSVFDQTDSLFARLVRMVSLIKRYWSSKSKGETRGESVGTNGPFVQNGIIKRFRPNRTA